MWTSQRILVYLFGLVTICLTYFNDHPISISALSPSSSSSVSSSFVSAVTGNITVSKSCSPGHCLSTTSVKCCLNLKQAVNIVENYETIFLKPGEYSGIGNTGLCGGIRNCTFIGVSLVGTSEFGVSIVGTNQDNTLNRFLHIHDSSFSLIANITFRNFRLSSNDGTQSSGGVFFIENSTVVLKNVRFLDNFSSYGGALSATRSALYVSNCTFSGNRVFSTGGAISTISANLTIVQSTFVNNTARSKDNDLSAFGGAISFLAQPTEFLNIYDSTFRLNIAQRSGGAIAIQPQGLTAGPSYVYIGRTVFIQNSASGEGACLSTSSCNTIGGAVYVNAANVTFEDIEFTQNSVKTISTPNVSFPCSLVVSLYLSDSDRLSL